MTAGVEFDDADDLFRWASVVSWRVAIDARRRCTRVSADQVPDRPDHTDVAQAAEHRIVLSAVTNRFKELSELDQAVLISGFDPQPAASRVDSVRLAVARHRARSRLRGLLNGLAVPAAAFLLRRRRWRSAPAEAFAATAGPALACFALTVGSFGGPALEPVAAQRPAHPVVQSSTPSAGWAPAAEAANASRGRTAMPSAAPPGQPAPQAEVSIPQGPDGQPTVARLRPKQSSDHLACVTLPSVTGNSTTCVDGPVTGR